MKKRLFIALGAILFGNLTALPAQAADCVGPDCEVIFSFTGAPETFSVPAGVSSIDFEVVAASGGDGGLGGKVTGTLQNLPSELIIVVGGAGSVGPEAPGGYNGGGKAGGFAGNEGSGGGASDIRLGADLASRIVVAGGGGGIGGRIGGFGGDGGGFTGETGGSGQGSGGRGGSHLMGGSGGYSNGGTAAARGVLGLGGAGGSASYSGGGGGGGGYFGGGGGGADNATCCTDGGGGGGGSSHTNPDYVSEYFHTQGANQGNGYIKLSYTRQVEVIFFSGVQLDSTSLQFDLGLSFQVPISLSQFNTDQISCGFASISELISGFRLSFSDCQDGNQTLILSANALAPGVPATDLSSAVAFDRTPPSFSWQPGEIASDNQTVGIEYSLSEDQLTAGDFALVGCAEVTIQSGNLQLTGCTETQASITLLAGSLTDSWGNLAPIQDLVQTFEFDRTGPEITNFTFTSDDQTANHTLQLEFSEPAQVDTSALQAPAGCSFTTSLSDTSLTISGNCGYEPASYLLPASSLVDAWGNTGPTTDFVHEFQLVDPTPPVAPEPEPTPEPEPEPTSGSEQQPEIASETPAETSDPVTPEEETLEEIGAEQPQDPQETNPGEYESPALPEEDSSAPVADTADVVRQEEATAEEPRPAPDTEAEPSADVIREPGDPVANEDSTPEAEPSPEPEPGRPEEPVREEDPVPAEEEGDATDSPDPGPEPGPEPEVVSEPIAQPSPEEEQEVGSEQVVEVLPEVVKEEAADETPAPETNSAEEVASEPQVSLSNQLAEVPVLDVVDSQLPETADQSDPDSESETDDLGILDVSERDSFDLRLAAAELPEREEGDEFPMFPLMLFGLGAVAGATFLGYRFSGR